MMLLEKGFVFLLNIILLIDEAIKGFGINVVNFSSFKRKTKILEKVKQHLLL